MDAWVRVQQRVAPDLTPILQRRYAILRNAYFLAPVGRRSLASRLAEGERIVRKEINFLRDQGLLHIDADGIRITPEGEESLWALKDYLHQLRGLEGLESDLLHLLGLQRVVVVAGDADRDETVKKEMARATARLLREILPEEAVMAVSGGTTLAEVADAIQPGPVLKRLTVVPARGGLGEDVERQANTVAAKLATTLGGSYRLLHIPDVLGEEAITSIVGEPRIQEIIRLIKGADLVLHGIGTAEEMAARRGFTPEQISGLLRLGAVGEAFGYYFSCSGDRVYTTSSAGLRLEDLGRIARVIAVGGGESKGRAALAVLRTGYTDTFVTDEGAARAILRLVSQEGGDGLSRNL